MLKINAIVGFLANEYEEVRGDDAVKLILDGDKRAGLEKDVRSLVKEWDSMFLDYQRSTDLSADRALERLVRKHLSGWIA